LDFFFTTFFLAFFLAMVGLLFGLSVIGKFIFPKAFLILDDAALVVNNCR